MKKASYLKISRRNLKRWSNVIYVSTVIVIGIWQLYSTSSATSDGGAKPSAGSSPAAALLQQLPVKGRAPKTGYNRALFSDGWGNVSNCDARNFILARDMTNVAYVDNTCKVKSGTLADPYSGKTIEFERGPNTSDDVQIDHVVALGDAWQKGAQLLTSAERYSLANDPLELLAVDGQTNQDKGDGDTASWTPPNKSYRCQYVARQIAVKTKYRLWVTSAEYQAMAKILSSCPDQTVPTALLLQNPVASPDRLLVSLQPPYGY